MNEHRESPQEEPETTEFGDEGAGPDPDATETEQPETEQPETEQPETERDGERSSESEGGEQ